MRVLMTTDTVGGVWTYSLQLAAALSEFGIHVDLAAMGGKILQNQRDAAGALPNITLHSSTFALEWMPEPWDDVDRAGEWLLELEQQLQPDVIHLNGYAHGVLPFRAPVLMVGHSCVLSWWRAVRHEEAPMEWNIYRRRVQDGIRAADYVVAPTQAMLDALLEHYGPLRRTAVVYNGRSAALFHPSEKRPMIFSAGRLWDEAKNLRALDAAAAQVTWPVYVAGDLAHPGEGSHVRQNHVHCVGRLTEREIASHLCKATIYAMPARYEPFGLSILEAALARCALVIGDISSLREVWGDSALYVPPDDTAALAETLQSLVADRATRELYADRAQRRAARYTLERMGFAYVQLYRTLVSSKERTPQSVSISETAHAK